MADGDRVISFARPGATLTLITPAWRVTPGIRKSEARHRVVPTVAGFYTETAGAQPDEWRFDCTLNVLAHMGLGGDSRTTGYDETVQHPTGVGTSISVPGTNFAQALRGHQWGILYGGAAIEQWYCRGVETEVLAQTTPGSGNNTSMLPLVVRYTLDLIEV